MMKTVNQKRKAMNKKMGKMLQSLWELVNTSVSSVLVLEVVAGVKEQFTSYTHLKRTVYQLNELFTNYTHLKRTVYQLYPFGYPFEKLGD